MGESTRQVVEAVEAVEDVVVIVVAVSSYLPTTTRLVLLGDPSGWTYLE